MTHSNAADSHPHHPRAGQDDRLKDTLARTAGELGQAAADQVRNAADQVGRTATRAVQAVKPRLRGWIHTVTAPLSLIAGIVLVALTPAEVRWASVVFAISGFVLFTMSAVYHRGTWSPRVTTALRKLDHSNVFLLIAGTYTPLSVVLLEDPHRTVVLAIAWGGALAGILLKFVWIGAPRWLYVPIYIALGWMAVWFLPEFWKAGGAALVWLVIAGGIAYTLGAIAYAFKRPNPFPEWFGFHEIFHVGTVLGWGSHYAAVLIAVLTLA
ncbi:MAG TPA: hemolysin III family protein [Actinomycetaceae bacterium]|nr:hemolysin III family protein [Actinomycetaceae bacterium]